MGDENQIITDEEPENDGDDEEHEASSQSTLLENAIPRHPVSVPGFFISRYPVTQAQWILLNGIEMPTDALFCGDHKWPIDGVSWNDAIDFCQQLTQRTQRTYRLPTEAEWEYACRAGTNTPFYFGETITSDLVHSEYYPSYFYDDFDEDVPQEPVPVDHYVYGNAFGLWDMHGNVNEWCADCWHDNYRGAPNDGSAWTDVGKRKRKTLRGGRMPQPRQSPSGSCKRRVLRGGGWYSGPLGCRSAYRYQDVVDRRVRGNGFRTVASALANSNPSENNIEE
ncbi:MAG: formylglycine-generating enzyme family protein [Merismopedia sp. SIO2A8]|nr:formylglycine-generating enzyme family protein [Merismopedia sp. SIO2A8]